MILNDPSYEQMKALAKRGGDKLLMKQIETVCLYIEKTEDTLVEIALEKEMKSRINSKTISYIFQVELFNAKKRQEIVRIQKARNLFKGDNT